MAGTGAGYRDKNAETALCRGKKAATGRESQSVRLTFSLALVIARLASA